MSLKNSLIFLSGLYFAVLIWWVSLTLSGSREGWNNNLFSLFWTLFFFLCSGSVYFHLIKLRKVLYRRYLIKSSFFLATGLLVWGLANLLWSIYVVFLGIEVPFPSYADVIFLFSYTFTFTGLLHLCSENSQMISKGLNKMIALFIFAEFFFSLCVLLSIAFGFESYLGLDLLKILLSYVYPFNDLVIITFMVIYLVSLYFKKIPPASPFVSFGFFVPLIALLFSDISFLIETNIGKYYNASFVDMSFITYGYFLTLYISFVLWGNYRLSLSDCFQSGINYMLKFTYARSYGLNVQRRIINWLIVFLVFTFIVCYH